MRAESQDGFSRGLAGLPPGAAAPAKARGEPMPKIVFIHPDGARQALEIAEGTSVMDGATSQGVDAIVAECGGNCMCATCHVYVDPARLDSLPALSEDEDALLDSTASERRPNSRLSCQLTVTPALDGLELTLPERQT